MGVVVNDGSGAHVGPELRLALRVQRLVEVRLALIKAILAHHHRPGGVENLILVIAPDQACQAKHGDIRHI